MLQSIYSSTDELNNELASIVSNIDQEQVTINNPDELRKSTIDKLVYTAVLADDAQLRDYTQKLIRKIAHAFGAVPSSIHNVYMAVGTGGVSGFTVPAMNIRALTYDTTRRVFKLAHEHSMGTMIFEIANSEQGYTDQQPSEYSASILAAAIKENYKGPVFIQGDHYQFKADKFAENKDGEIQRMKDLIKRSIEAEFYNIDIDGSTLVDLKKPDVDQQQKNNYEMTALMTDYIRSIEPEGLTISIGGEIGHIGGVNSNVADFEAFMDGLLHQENYTKHVGISKVSVQTGTSHGGIPMPDGTIKEVSVDFNVLKDIGEVGRSKYKIGGAVQHGASTLPEGLFNKFPENKTLEIHLATGFQNIVFDHMPEELKQRIYTWVRENLAGEKTDGQSDEQFVYTLRKKANGPFKKELWSLNESEKNLILDKLEEKFKLLFEKLQAFNTFETVKQHV